MGSEVQDAVNEVIEKAHEKDRQENGLNTAISLLVALSATCMALCNVKDGNVVQAMTQAQTSSVDAWGYYQAKSIKQALAEATLDELSSQRDVAGLTPESRAQLDKRIKTYQERVAHYETQKAELKTNAENLTKEYDRLNIHDDQLDIAEASFSISIALYGISALTRKRWLVGLALGFSSLGLLFGLAGFLRWGLHPEFLVKIFA
jgi:hypothetical protein